MEGTTDMNTKQRVIDMAKRDAAREGKTMLVLNLNPFGALYVVRDYSDTLAFSDKVVAVVEPDGSIA
jgi:hypothetical protein